MGQFPPSECFDNQKPDESVNFNVLSGHPQSVMKRLATSLDLSGIDSRRAPYLDNVAEVYRQ